LSNCDSGKNQERRHKLKQLHWFSSCMAIDRPRSFGNEL
jgi:hypothetical protein